MTNETIKRNVGIGLRGMPVGKVFTSQTSEVYGIGEEMITWAGLRVRVTGMKETPTYGSWKFEYTFEVIEPRQEVK